MIIYIYANEKITDALSIYVMYSTNFD